MKALFIGGTGNISMSISQKLLASGWDLTLIHRHAGEEFLPGVRHLHADINGENNLVDKLADERFDVAADFIAFVPEQIKRDVALFSGKVGQFMFISSASAYQKPLSSPFITESTPLSNPFWKYSRDKIACEEALMTAYRETAFPMTIVRPSHTYSERHLPVPVHGSKGPWQVVKRMLAGKPVLVPGDGSSLWTVTTANDFADGFIGLMGNIHAIGEAFHITSDESLTWNQIMTIIANVLGVPYKPCYVPSAYLVKCTQFDFSGALLGDKSNTVIFNNDKVKRLVPGFVCKTRFDQGARDSLAYMLEHTECQRDDPEFDVYCDHVVAAMEALPVY